MDDLDLFHTSHKVATAVSQARALEETSKTLTQGRDDRATSEQVLDPRTRLLLFKLLSQGFLQKLDGCLSTGKEANVYYGEGNEMAYAIKIYKTSILVFKDRDKYVAGENRWKQGYCKSNPRKMVQVWAEKEYRNYRRIHTAGIPCPKPVLLKSHVLVMEFLGQDGWPSPRLKDAHLSTRKLAQAYRQSCLLLRQLFQRCRLVHGDCSEYNLLWHNSQVYVIDVSQSVETDHPAALDFLRNDIRNVTDYFKKQSVCVMMVRQLFEYVTMDLPDEESALDSILEHVIEATEPLTETERRRQEQQEAVDEAVFMSSFLPRSLYQVAEHEIQKLEDGQAEESLVQAVAAMTGEVARPTGKESVHAILLEDDSDEDESDDESDSEDEERYVKVPRTAEELEAERLARKADRKANKKAVKEQATERRMTKVKKKDKKRMIKKSKAGNRKNK